MEEYPDYAQRLAKAQEILQGFIWLEYEDQVQLVEGKLGMSVEEFKMRYEMYQEE